MLDAARLHPTFRQRYEAVCDALGSDPALELQRDPAFINRNAVSSLLTVLSSAVALDRYRTESRGTPSLLAGYSVGQWTALYAAGCLSFEALVEVTAARARHMDDCFRRVRGAMIAVIGVGLDRLERMCSSLRVEGHSIFISNINCHGQYSVGGTESAIEAALEEVGRLQPKRVVRLPTSGAWHTPLLKPAEAPFAAFLHGVAIAPPGAPVVNNVTGDFFPTDVTAMKRELVRHLSHPVQWERGVKGIIAAGGRQLIEVGYGDVLTRFGFFIDRSASHTTFPRDT